MCMWLYVCSCKISFFFLFFFNRPVQTFIWVVYLNITLKQNLIQMNDFRTFWTCLNGWAIPLSSHCDLSKQLKRIFKVSKPAFYLEYALNPFHVQLGIVCPYMIHCMQLISLLVNLLLLMWRHSIFYTSHMKAVFIGHNDVKLNTFLTPAPLLRTPYSFSDIF